MHPCNAACLSIILHVIFNMGQDFVFVLWYTFLVTILVPEENWILYEAHEDCVVMLYVGIPLVQHLSIILHVQ